jgi:hypothetical protein
MSKIDAIKRFLGLHVHNRRLFLIGDYCMVKCTDPKCGMESIPWRPPLKAAEEARPFHKNDAKDYMELERKLKEFRA